MRYGIVSANLLLLFAIGTFAIIDGSTMAGSSNSEAKSLATTIDEDSPSPLDQVSSADVAVNVARITGMDQATAVANTADTINAQQAVAASDDQVIAKPQVISTDLKSKHDITKYTVKQGDTVPSIARQFGVTSETIRLSNGLSGDIVERGLDLWISPINGMVYKVKAGDTIDSIATRYRADKSRLIAFNDAEVTGRFEVGERIVIPDATEPVQQASPYTNYYGSSSSSVGGASSGGYGLFNAAYGGNGYDYGWCTWHAANRRADIGRPIPNNLGNAISWLSLSQASGLSTGSEPRAGAVVYHLDIGGLGHVAFVEKVRGDGSLLVSDMNYPTWGSVTYRTVKPSEFGNYRFIY